MIRKKAQNVYGTTDEAHPGVKKFMTKGMFTLRPIQLINRPKHDEFSDFHLDPEKHVNYSMI